MYGLPSIDWWQVGWMLAGFFLVLTIALLLGRRKPLTKRVYKRYVTEIPSKLVIEEEAE